MEITTLLPSSSSSSSSSSPHPSSFPSSSLLLHHSYNHHYPHTARRSSPLQLTTSIASPTSSTPSASPASSSSTTPPSSTSSTSATPTTSTRSTLTSETTNLNHNFNTKISTQIKHTLNPKINTKYSTKTTLDDSKSFPLSTRTCTCQGPPESVWNNYSTQPAIKKIIPSSNFPFSYSSGKNKDNKKKININDKRRIHFPSFSVPNQLKLDANPVHSKIPLMPATITPQSAAATAPSNSSSFNSIRDKSLAMNYSHSPDSGPQRHRPPMLKLDSQTNPSANNTNKINSVNLSNLNRNTATTTTTLSATPSNSLFPALRTPKDIVLQDITLQCISPALPSFGSKVLDAMTRSKTIQEEQRKLIAQRIHDEDGLSDNEDYNNHLRQGISSPPPESSVSPTASSRKSAENKSAGDSDRSTNNSRAEKASVQKRSPQKPGLIVCESGKYIIETVPTPTDTHVKLDSNKNSMNPLKRKSRPESIKLFPYSNGPSIKSAPLRRAPYSPHAAYSRKQYARRSGAASALSPVLSTNYKSATSRHRHMYQAYPQQTTLYHRPGTRGQYAAAPLTAVPVSHSGARSYSGWPRAVQPSNSMFGRAHTVNRATVEDEDEDEEDEEEDDGRDPEDAAISDDDEAVERKKRRNTETSSSVSNNPGIVVEEEEDEGHMSDMESRAIGEEDELNFQRQKRRRMLHEGFGQIIKAVVSDVTTSGNPAHSAPANSNAKSNTASLGSPKAKYVKTHSQVGGLKEEQLKKQRYLELCSELWDTFRS